MRGENRKEQTEVREQKIRQSRVPVSGPRDILTVYGKDPNFQYRFVLDDGNRIARFQRGGWEIVNDDLEVGAPRVGVPASEGTPVKISSGAGTTCYLMRIPMEFWKEDQAAKSEQILDMERAMMELTKQPGMYGEISKS